jgi:hypothetical protein
MNNKFIRIINSRIFEYILLAIVIIAGFGVRLYKISNPVADWHSWRQADTASVSRLYVEGGINLLLPRYHDISSIQTGIANPQGLRMVEFPFFNAVNAILAVNFKPVSLEVWARLITIFCALTTAGFLYLIGNRVIGRWGGLLTAFFYLFLPFNIYFTRVILPDPMGVMFGVIAIWAFLKFYDKGKIPLAIISSVFLAMALLIKPYLGFYLFPIVYLALKKYGLKSFFKNRNLAIGALIYLTISFAPFLLWRWWEGRFPEGIPFYLWAFNGNLIRFKPAFWYWVFGERLGHLILGSFGIVPFIFGILNTKVKNRLVHAFLGGSLFYLIVVATANVMHDYYQILIIPAVALGLAAGSVLLWTTDILNRFMARILLVMSVGIMLITGWNQITGNYAVNHPEILEAGAAVDKIAPKDALILAPYNGDTAFLYATKRQGWPAVDDSIDNIIAKGADYYASVDLGSADTKMIEAKYKTVERTERYVIIDLNSPIGAKK